MNKELSMDLVCGIVADFMNAIDAGDNFAFEKTVHAFKNNIEMTDEQEAMVRNSLTHLETIAQNCKEDFNLKGFVGMECNIILWTLAADWHCLNTRTLGDKEGFTPDSLTS